jgi:DNA-binding response OmpR family regulator
VEDDESLAQMLREALTSQHYLVDVATDGEAGWELVEAFEYDLILLDLMLPKLDGISFCKQQRSKGDRTPILLLTGHDSRTNKVMGLDAGADDYMVKPFDLHELLARIRALLRRGSSSTAPVLEWGCLSLDPGKCEVTYDGQLLRLTAKEYSLLELFLRNTQRIFSQSALLDHLWSFEEPPSENTVRAHIKSLRQKLKKAGAAADLIETVYGLGYRLKSDYKLQSTKDKESLPSPNSTPPHQEEDRGAAPIPNSKTTTEASQTQEQILPEMTGIWERFKEKYSDRLKVVEEAVRAVLKGTLTEELRQQALREAHTLAGSLGSFGLVEASRLSREIEQTFQSGEGEGDSWVAPTMGHLSGLVVALRKELEKPLATVEQQTPRPTSIEQQPRLLVVDDDVALALALTGEATAWGMQAEVACSITEARKAIARVRPDVVLLDLCFPDSAENGFGLLAELTTSEPPVPVLVFTAHESFADRLKVARLGGQGFLQKPVSPAQVREAIAHVLQKSHTPEAKLLIVDDDPHLLDFLRTLLEPWGFKPILLDDPQQFWDTLERSAPDLLILDVEMPELSGIDLCQVVRNDPCWSDLPVLFLSAHTDTETVHRVFTAGADDYVTKPIVGPELVARVLNRVERTQILRKLKKLMAN